MKNVLSIMVLAVFVTFASCNTSKKAVKNAENNSLDGAYVIANVNGITMGEKGLVLTFDAENNSFSGTTECNGISGSYTIDNKNISFGPIIATRMYCEGKMDAEKNISDALSNATSYGIENNLLVFTDRENIVLLSAVLRNKQ
ncbi:MAG TPA: META domain-containing protein [Flavobacteriaceae bacterium]|nr:META domain-containing protein [Flavobacteriaceae bacterium]